MALKHTTLCVVINRSLNEVLMIEKKRGQGAGKWNFPGGKIAQGESELLGATRECQEETGIIPLGLQKMGILEFYFKSGHSWDNICPVFITETYSGTLISSSEECNASWVSLDQIPYDKMWEDDVRWVPLLLAGEAFHRAYVFGEGDVLLEEKVFRV